MMANSNCIFCKIIKGEIPSRKIYESETSIALLDIAPATKGHTVIIPKAHFYNLIDMPRDLMQLFFEDLQNVAKILMEKLKIEGFNVIQNNFEIAGQVVAHAHYHIIPRYQNDKIPSFKKDPLSSTEDDLNEIYRILTS